MVIPVIAISGEGCANVGSSSDLIAKADSDLEHGRYEEALEGYRRHRDDRLGDSDRPEWENPHFYTLLMGDVELRRGDPEAALALYTQADQERLSSSLVTDRYRALAAWHLEHGQFEKALGVLKTHRARDPLLFDAMLDRVAKEMTRQEESNSKTAIAKSHRSK
jgi:tetratricopeptide (TPR) repeat protein